MCAWQKEFLFYWWAATCAWVVQWVQMAASHLFSRCYVMFTPGFAEALFWWENVWICNIILLTFTKVTYLVIFAYFFSQWVNLSWSLTKPVAFPFTLSGLAWQLSVSHFNKFSLLTFSAAIHRNSPRPVKVPRCHSDPPNPHLIIPTPEGFRYEALLHHGLVSAVLANALESAGCSLWVQGFPFWLTRRFLELSPAVLRTHRSVLVAEERQPESFKMI